MPSLSRITLTGAVLAAAGIAAVGYAHHGTAQAKSGVCPAALSHVQRMVVVTAADMNSRQARLQLFERATPQSPWHADGPAEPAVLGSAGMGWALPFTELAAEGEPLKVEGDNRSPAGIFAFGPTFGFDHLDQPGHIALEKDRHICVDDIASPLYNQIVSRAEAGPGTSAEEMRDIATYKRGMVIDLPTDRAKRTGSCIFLHIWNGPDVGTGGCVGLPETSVETLQSWAGGGQAMIALVPEGAQGRLAGCLPERSLVDLPFR